MVSKKVPAFQVSVRQIYLSVKDFVRTKVPDLESQITRLAFLGDLLVNESGLTPNPIWPPLVE